MNGSALLKPVIAIAEGSFTMQDGQPLGPTAIGLHEALSHQLPFSLLVANPIPDAAIPENSFVRDINDPSLTTPSGVSYRRYLLRPTGETHVLPFLKLQSLTNNLTLFDSLVSHDTPESVNLVKRLQSDSQTSIQVVGGGPLFTKANELFSDYAEFQINLLKSKAAIKGFNFQRLILCYSKESIRSCYWLFFNAIALERFSSFYNVRVMTLSSVEIKPIAFHIFDDLYVYVGLRSYNSTHGTPVTKYSLCLESQLAALGFKGVFDEYWRGSEEMTPNKLRKAAEGLPDLTKDKKVKLRKEVEALFETTI